MCLRIIFFGRSSNGHMQCVPTDYSIWALILRAHAMCAYGLFYLGAHLMGTCNVCLRIILFGRSSYGHMQCVPTDYSIWARHCAGTCNVPLRIILFGRSSNGHMQCVPTDYSIWALILRAHCRDLNLSATTADYPASSSSPTISSKMSSIVIIPIASL